jgi:hypothetical protein
MIDMPELTVTVTVFDVDSDCDPRHVSVYVEVSIGLTTCVPVNDLLPDQPLEAAQETALVTLQESVAFAPIRVLFGVTDRLTCGVAAGNDVAARRKSRPGASRGRPS